MTAKRRQTLEERIVRFSVSSGSLAENLLRDVAMRDCVRAELDRLAIWVRKEIKDTAKLITPTISARERDTLEGRIAGYQDALQAIKQAKR